MLYDDVYHTVVVAPATANLMARMATGHAPDLASTVLLADRVALLQNGTITHVGTHTELLADVPEYRYLLAADDELDDGCEREVDWEQRAERERLDHEILEGRT